MKKIAQIMLKQVENRLKEQKFLIEIDESVASLIIDKGIDKTFGARPLRRTIQNLIEDKISEEILDGKLNKNKKSTINVVENEIVVNQK